MTGKYVNWSLLAKISINPLWYLGNLYFPLQMIMLNMLQYYPNLIQIKGHYTHDTVPHGTIGHLTLLLLRVFMV